MSKDMNKVFYHINNFVLKTLIPLFKNFYFLFAFLFFTWMLFFDSNDFLSQYAVSKKEYEMKKEKLYYEEKIGEVEKEREALLTNPEELEKFAREIYRMKKKSEDVYIVVEQ